MRLLPLGDLPLSAAAASVAVAAWMQPALPRSAGCPSRPVAAHPLALLLVRGLWLLLRSIGGAGGGDGRRHLGLVLLVVGGSVAIGTL